MIHEIYAAPKGGDLEKGIQFAVEHKLNYELPTFYYPENLDNQDDEILKYQLMLCNFKGKLSMHGPIFDTNPVSLDPKIAEASKYRYIQAIEAAKKLDVRYLVFHTQYTPIYQAANCMKFWLSKTTDFWDEIIAEHVQGSHLTLLLENYLDETPEYLQTILSRVNSSHLKACLDIGHVNLFSRVASIDWFDELGQDVVYIHTHNNDGSIDEHQAFDKGTINIESFLNHVALVPHRVHVAIETHSVESMASSLQMIEPFLKLQEEHFVSKSFLV